MLHMMRSMFDLLRTGVFYNRHTMFKQRTTRRTLLDQHRTINTALQNRNPQAPRAAIEAHLDYVEIALGDQQKSDHNEAVAKLRLKQEAGRG
jgi:GntR family transcriptional repressor for pyruvate dehydrogenase complex